LPDWIVASCEELAAAPRPTLVHLACGREILPGWVNADGADDVGADVVFDLGRCADERLPIGDDRVDGFFMGHAFAGIEATRAMLEELYRVARRDAKLVIRLPQATSSPERPARRYRLDTFAEWGQPGRAADWKVERVKLVVAPDVADTRAVADIAARMGTEANVVREIVVHLRAVKPPRAGDPRRLDAAAISVVSSPPDEDSRF
jgi:hypothetical protein